MDAEIRRRWTRDLAELVEQRDVAVRDADTVEDHLHALRLHSAVEDANAAFFGYQIRDALRAGATWPQVVAASDWEGPEVADVYLEWGYARFGSRSQEELAEVLEHIERYRREYQ
ncbi:MAG: hypothetical protein HOW97_35110 [Catenulispora sp.]|nr:hypothetical protein [Catenulispora sp.]